jgi:hypothetical protein
MRAAIAFGDEMVDLLSKDPALEAEVRQNPVAGIVKLAQEVDSGRPVYWGDTWVYRVAVIILGALALIAAIGSLALVYVDKSTPEVLVALGSAAAGALVGLFATSPSAEKQE